LAATEKNNNALIG